MPLMIIGGDTSAGRSIIEALNPSDREVRVFVTDESQAQELRNRGFKVATGDVSDESHVEAALTRCFTAVFVAEAASDPRERSFASTPSEVLTSWARAARNSGVSRVIWIASDPAPETSVVEVAVVDPADQQLAAKVTALDDARSLE